LSSCCPLAVVYLLPCQPLFEFCVCHLSYLVVLMFLPSLDTDTMKK
jgi:hypothetical protein